jgi:glucose/mannose-6-phosphate isomerase
MLDQADIISRYDQHDILGVITDQPNQLRQSYSAAGLSKLKKPTAIVVAGMGGSALAAEFIKHWLGDRLPVPLVIVRGYELPAFVDKSTLVVASSYSGNTEETVSCLKQAERLGATIVELTTGGHLDDEAKSHHLIELQVPAGLQPRMAVLYGVKALATLIESLGLLKDLKKELGEAADWVESQLGPWTPATTTEENPAKQLAEAFVGHPVVIYGGPTLALPAMKWKIDINENAKSLAFYNYLPEFNHNEFLGWGHPEDSGLLVVELQSTLDHPQVQKRFSATNRLLQGMMPDPIVVTAQGKTKLEQMLWTMLLGDYASAYLAFLNQVDPTPVPMIEKLKHELAD